MKEVKLTFRHLLLTVALVAVGFAFWWVFRCMWHAWTEGEEGMTNFFGWFFTVICGLAAFAGLVLLGMIGWISNPGITIWRKKDRKVSDRPLPKAVARIRIQPEFNHEPDYNFPPPTDEYDFPPR